VRVRQSVEEIEDLFGFSFDAEDLETGVGARVTRGRSRLTRPRPE